MAKFATTKQKEVETKKEVKTYKEEVEAYGASTDAGKVLMEKAIAYREMAKRTASGLGAIAYRDVADIYEKAAKDIDNGE